MIDYMNTKESPQTWEITTLGEICAPPQYGWTTKANFEKGSIRLLRTTDITSGKIDWASVPFCSICPANISKYKLETNDILISRAGSVGTSILLEDIPYDSVFASYLIRFRPIKPNDPKYIAYFLQTRKYWESITERSSGIAMLNVNAQKLKTISIPVAPPEDQRKIVARIEELFSKLDAGKAALERVRANLKRYRASVLKAAVDGLLTEEWRRQNPDVEPASELLKRILVERCRKWEETQLSIYEKKGKLPPKGWKDKYPEPKAPDTSNLPPLPKGWTWARSEQIGFTFGGLTKNPKRAKLPKQYPYLRVANVYANELRLDNIEQIGVEDSELEKLLLRAGDLLIIEGNGSKDQIGRLAIWDGSINPCVHQNHVIKIRPIILALGKWILSWLLSPVGRYFIELVASSTSGLYTLSVNKVGDLLIALPSLTEQIQIIAEVERRLSVLDDLESVVSVNYHRAKRIRQSILKCAFERNLIS